MNPRNILSCYCVRAYPCNRRRFLQTVSDFETTGRACDEVWERLDQDPHTVVFSRGAPLKFSFRYDSDDLQIKAIFRLHPDIGEMTLSVGNWGFPFEAWLSRQRYQRELERIDHLLADIARHRPTPDPSAEHPAVSQFAASLAGLVRENRTDEDARRLMYQLITDFGSETPDNADSAKRLTVLTDEDQRGLGTRSGILLSEILNRAEDHAPPENLLAEMPTLMEADWHAALRICTLLLSDLEVRIVAGQGDGDSAS